MPGYRFNTHSAAHNIINATGIVEELDLRAAGLDYREMDPFPIAVHADGAIVRFHRSVEQTVESIRQVAPVDADRYRAWMADTMPIVTALRAGLDAGADRAGQLHRLPANIWAAARALARNGGPLGARAAAAVALRAGVSAPPDQRPGPRPHLGIRRARVGVSQCAGSAIYGLWQAFYHQVGQWHAVGGAQGLIDALTRRLESYGGQWRTGAVAIRVIRDGPRVTGVELEAGEHIPTSCVFTAIDPKTALLKLLDPPLSGAPGSGACGHPPQ